MNFGLFNAVRSGLLVAVVGGFCLGAVPSLALAQSGLQKFAADVTINSVFDKVLHRSPDDSERRRYRVRIFEDHWESRDIEDDLRGRRDHWTEREVARELRNSDEYRNKGGLR